MTPAQFKEWYDTLKSMLPTHDAMVYKVTLWLGIIATVAANFGPEAHRQTWMNVGAAVTFVGAKLGSSPAASPAKPPEQP